MRLSDHGGAVRRMEKTKDGVRYVRALCSDGTLAESFEFSKHNKRPYRRAGKIKAELSDPAVWAAHLEARGWADMDAKLSDSRKSRKGPVYGEPDSRGWIRVRRSAVSAVIPSGYKGNRINVRAAESVCLTGLNWDGGSRSVYSFHRLDNGQSVNGESMGRPAPWNNPYEGKEVPIPPGCCVVEHCWFRGRQSLDIHVHPSNMPKLLGR